MATEALEKAFHDTLAALGQETLDNVVVVGGWCPYVYAKYVWRNQAPALLTQDIDFAVKRMSPDGFSEPVYKKLLKADMVPRRMDMDDDNRTQFAWQSGNSLVPIEFITAPNILPHGQEGKPRPYVACDPVSEVAIALRVPPVETEISSGGERLRVQVTAPAAFVVKKALLLKHRVNSRKTPKDLASIAFVLSYSPSPEALSKELEKIAADPAAKEARKILSRTMAKELAGNFPLLSPYLVDWGISENLRVSEMERIFRPLLDQRR